MMASPAVRRCSILTAVAFECLEFSLEGYYQGTEIFWKGFGNKALGPRIQKPLWVT